MALVASAASRIDDLILANGRRLDDLRAAETRRVDGMHESMRVHMCEMMAIRAEHSRDLNAAETKRIDAIRAVDVAAVAIATDRAGAAATVLANQVAASAETLRALVASTATASQQQSTASFGQLADRITLLERTSYEGSGKSAVIDPQLTRLMAQMETVSMSMSQRDGRSTLSQPLIMLIATGGGALILFMIEVMFKGHGG